MATRRRDTACLAVADTAPHLVVITGSDVIEIPGMRPAAAENIRAAVETGRVVEEAQRTIDGAVTAIAGCVNRDSSETLLPSDRAVPGRRPLGVVRREGSTWLGRSQDPVKASYSERSTQAALPLS
jgi:hypothetical protein